jgi:hypothetical protein
MPRRLRPDGRNEEDRRRSRLDLPRSHAGARCAALAPPAPGSTCVPGQPTMPLGTRPSGPSPQPRCQDRSESPRARRTAPRAPLCSFPAQYGFVGFRGQASAFQGVLQYPGV